MKMVQIHSTALALTLLLARASAQTTQKVTVTAEMLSASSIYNGYTPITAFDGNMAQNSGWTTLGGVRQAWLAVDFGAPRHIAYVRVFPDRYLATDPSYSYLDRFRIEVWSNATWQAVTPLIATPEEQWYSAEVNFTTAQLRFWCESDGNGPQVKEIEIYEVLIPPQLAIARSNAMITVSWPLPTEPGWVLEATNALPSAAASWPQIPPPYQTNAGLVSKTLTNAPAVGNQFYRLHKP